MMAKKVQHLVVDAGALIKNAPIFDISENVYTLPEIVAEIKDKATRQRLQVLPYEIKFREPSAENIKIVTEFSKKTGDYPVLSANDLKVLALTYLLEKEHVGMDHLNKEPPPRSLNSASRVPELSKPLAGFYRPKKETDDSEANDGETEQDDLDEKSDNSAAENEEKENVEDEEEEGWITSSNLKAAQKKMGALSLDDAASATVACITTDFAMQNVLMQMGLRVMSVEGMLIRRCNTFILRCHACFSTTTVMTKQFCPSCGNKTLKRVAVSVGEDGSRTIHINFKRPIRIRGTRYSLPRPKGGKHADNPVLCEDQRIPQNRPPKSALQKVNPLDPDYEARSSPFAMNDVYSRAANLGIRAKRSANENRRRR